MSEREIREVGELDELYLKALMLAKVIIRTLSNKGQIKFSHKPVFELSNVVEFMKRMRVWSMEKFDSGCYAASVSFYLSEKDREQHRAVGAIVLYIEEDYMPALFKRLGYPNLDEDDHAGLIDACGTLCNVVAGLLNSGLTQLGYQDLILSPFTANRNEIPEGVEYDNEETRKYEISFKIRGVKRIIGEITMGDIPNDVL